MWNLKFFYLPKNSKTVTKWFRNGTVSEKLYTKNGRLGSSETVNRFGLLKCPPGFFPKQYHFGTFNRTWLLGGVPKLHHFGIIKRFRNGKNGSFWGGKYLKK